MTICSQCKRSYADQDFRICPFDGSVLSDEETSATDPLLGKVFAGRFRIIEQIGKGGMGCVYKAIHIQMDRVCAIKVLLPLTGDQDAAGARFRREARMSSRIDNPNAVTIYDFGEAEGGQFYLAMEYIEGDSLAHILNRQKLLPVARVINITEQIARALSAAHALGIVHRDLKPANIMLTQKQGTEFVKVLDFGIAKSLTDDDSEKLTQSGFLLGTPTFMSPEQVLGEPVDSRSDVYSLAIIVYQMLSGSLPFDGENLRTLIMKRVNSEPKPLRATAPFLNAGIERAVMMGLERDPDRRTADVDQFATALRSAAEDSQQDIETALILSAEDADPSVTLVLSQQAVSATADPSSKKKISFTWGLFFVAAIIIVLAGTAVVAVAYFIYSTSNPANHATNAPQNQPTSHDSQSVPSATEAEGPNSRTAANNNAVAYFQAGKQYQQEASALGSGAEAISKNNAAVSEYRKAIADRANFPQAHENLGVALYSLGRFSEAIIEYEIAIKQYGNPTAQVLTNYGMALILAKRFAEAADAFAQALTRNPSDSDLHYYRGFALHYAGNLAGSREAFQRYLEESPQGPHANDARNILDHRAAPTMSVQPKS